MTHQCTSSLALLTAMLVAAGCGTALTGSGGRADVFEAVRTSPREVELSVASCNQGPFVAELEQTSPGEYEVLVRTRVGNNGKDCNDLVTIEIDPNHPAVAITDRASGQTFNLLGSGEPSPLGLNGVWRMTTVDIGHPVEAGRTTVEVPEITIRAGEESGVIEGNFGCNNLAIEVTFTNDMITGQPGSLDGSTEPCSAPDSSAQLMLAERTLLDLLTGEQPAEIYLSGDHFEIGTLATNAVFERVSG